MFENINEIDFITSEACNLNCSYCEIAKRANHKNIQKNQQKIINSFYTGEYLKLYKEFCKDYNININKIQEINFWGQEPTLTLEAVEFEIQNILNWLQNVTSIFFSTNGVSNIQKIINIINTLNNYSYQNNRELCLKLQISFDGFKETLIQRGIDPFVIINNIKFLINNLNNIEFNNIFHVQINLHGVIDFNTIKNQIQNNIFNNYWQSIADLMLELNDLNKNKRVHFWPYSAFTPTMYNGTKEEGKLFSDYTKLCFDNFYNKKNINLVDYLSPFFLIFKYIKDVRSHDILEQINDNYNIDFKDNSIFGNTINLNYGCNINTQVLKMRYDGTLLYCHNAIFDLTQENLLNRYGVDKEIAELQLLNKNCYPNYLKDSKEQICNFINMFETYRHYQFPLVYSNTLNLMYLLLQNDQIDISYNDYEKMLRHNLYLYGTQQCFYNRKFDTGSFYNTNLGVIRTWCNGVFDQLEQYFEEIEKDKK